MRIKVVVLFFLCLISVEAQQVSDWIEATGECYVTNITPEEAKQRAIKIAQTDAIKKVVGDRITEVIIKNQSETTDDYYELFSKLCKSTSSGRIVKNEILNSAFDKSESVPKIIVKIRVKVAKDTDQPDPNFFVDINLEKNLLFDRGSAGSDEIKFKIRATKDCYLYIFNLMANDSVQMILPNQFIKDNQYITSRDEQEYEKLFKKISFRVSVPPGKESTVEALWVVALKVKYDMVNDIHRSRKFEDANSIIGAIYDIQEWLLQIPFDQRTEGFSSFQIVKK